MWSASLQVITFKPGTGIGACFESLLSQQTAPAASHLSLDSHGSPFLRRTVRFHQALCLLLVLLLAAAVKTCSAQDYVISFRHWDMSDGLAHRQVNAGTIDKDGFMWLATANGLSRFDRYGFLNFDSKNAGLPFNDIRQIVQAPDGMLWLMGTAGVNNICLFDPHTRRARRPRRQLTVAIQQIAKLHDGRIALNEGAPGNAWLIATGDTAYARFPVNLDHPYLFHTITKDNSLWLSKGGSDMYSVPLFGGPVRNWKLPLGLAAGIRFIIPDNTIFAQPESGGALYEIRDGTEPRPVGYVAPKVEGKLDYVFHTGVNGIIWRQGRLYHPQLGKLRDFPAEGWTDLEASVRMVLVVKPGDIWIGGSFGLYHINIRQSLFRKYFFDATNKQVPENGFRGMLKTGDRLLAMHEVRGVMSHGQKHHDTSLLFDGLRRNFARFTALTQLQDSTILFVGFGRIFTANKDCGNITPQFDLGPIGIWSVREWSRDTLLLGTVEGLLWYSRSSRAVFPFNGYNGFEVLREATVNSIAAQPGGLISICASNGIYLMDKGRTKILQHYGNSAAGKNFLPADRFFECLADGNGQYWLSTGSGLIHWNPETGAYRLLTTKDGFSNDVIYAALPDAHGRLWLPSDFGLMRYDTASGQVVTFFSEDGISSNEFNRISSLQTPDGTMFLGSINGITVFHPDSFLNGTGHDISAAGAPLVITSFQQSAGDAGLQDHTSDLLSSGEITLTNDSRFCALELSVLNYPEPENITYFWRIDGLDKSWHVQKDRTIRLSGLPYGDYVLRIRGREGNGLYSKNEILLRIRVPAPFYRTWVFILLIALLLFGCVVVFFRIRTRRARREKCRLEDIVAARTRKLRETLDQKDLLLKEVHHRVKNNLQIITSLQRMQGMYSKDAEVKAAMEESANRILSIAFIHQNLYRQDEVQGVEMNRFVEELVQHIAYASAIPGTAVAVEVSVPNFQLDIDTAVPLGLLLNELVTNSYKHAFPQRATGAIRIGLNELGNGKYSLDYTDDGVGLPAHFRIEESSSMGMQLVYDLSEQVGGKLAYANENGARFTLRFYDYDTRNNML